MLVGVTESAGKTVELGVKEAEGGPLSVPLTVDVTVGDAVSVKVPLPVPLTVRVAEGEAEIVAFGVGLTEEVPLCVWGEGVADVVGVDEVVLEALCVAVMVRVPLKEAVKDGVPLLELVSVPEEEGEAPLDKLDVLLEVKVGVALVVPE